MTSKAAQQTEFGAVGQQAVDGCDVTSQAQHSRPHRSSLPARSIAVPAPTLSCSLPAPLYESRMKMGLSVILASMPLGAGRDGAGTERAGAMGVKEGGRSRRQSAACVEASKRTGQLSGARNLAHASVGANRRASRVGSKMPQCLRLRPSPLHGQDALGGRLGRLGARGRHHLGGLVAGRVCCRGGSGGGLARAGAWVRACAPQGGVRGAADLARVTTTRWRRACGSQRACTSPYAAPTFSATALAVSLTASMASRRWIAEICDSLRVDLGGFSRRRYSRGTFYRNAIAALGTPCAELRWSSRPRSASVTA